MWPFSKHARLLRMLETLAFYNDKGAIYAHHTSEQRHSEQSSRLAKIKDIVAAIGLESFPPEFIEAIESGEMASDFTGKYIDLLKTHFA